MVEVYYRVRRMDLSKIRQFVRSNGDKFILVENGEPEIVVMSFPEYEKLVAGNSPSPLFAKEGNVGQFSSASKPSERGVAKNLRVNLPVEDGKVAVAPAFSPDFLTESHPFDLGDGREEEAELSASSNDEAKISWGASQDVSRADMMASPAPAEEVSVRGSGYEEDNFGLEESGSSRSRRDTFTSAIPLRLEDIQLEDLPI